MIKRVLAFFYTDLQWKLLALGLSVLLWLVSMAMFDPEQNHSYPRPLVLDNLEILENEDVVLLNADALSENIIIGVRAAASLHTLAAEMEMRPSIDFRAVSGREVHAAAAPMEMALPVSVNLPGGFVLHHVYPSEIYVWVDARVRVPFPVEVIQTGVAGAGAELQRVRIDNSFVTLTGPRSIIDRVVRVQVVAEIHGLTESASRIARLMVYDAFGYDMKSYLELSVTETTLHIELFPIQRIAIQPEITGTPALGFAVAGFEVNPAEIDLVGPPERLAEIDALVPSFDLDQANRDFDHFFALTDWLPEGVSLAQGVPTGAHLEVAIEPIQERAFTISRGSIGVFGYMQYSVLSDLAHVTVRVSGPTSIMQTLTAADITLHLNLRNLPIGIHRVPLQVILPSGLRAVGPAPSLEVQIYEPPGNDEEPDYSYPEGTDEE
ncbi:MAG: CdaR family protein [Defluviitaleaceae bacterium]|nr:CdaR family protein [Defluviitaleaceae bacterium]MCL2240149.1 CdaR family protein [Defluviitaleaceae bacterium]